jgi:RHS repeat-associated protein
VSKVRSHPFTHDGSGGSFVITEDLKFLSDGWRHVAELNATNNALVRSYVWGLDLSDSLNGAGGVGGLLILNSVANGAHFYAYDGNGNVAALVRAIDATVSANYEFDPFGQTTRATGLIARENPFRFSTKRFNDATDLSLYEHRPYGPSQGRFLSRDPIHELGFGAIRRSKATAFNRTSVNMREDGNLYNFSRNDPLNDLDLLGLCDYNCNRCGENVTLYVFRTLQDIADTYEKAPWYKKRRAVWTMFGFNSIHSWDIEWLKHYNSPRWAGCNSESVIPGCWATVTFEGKCVSIHELNYMMYGWAALYTGQNVDWSIYTLYLGLYYRILLEPGGTETLDSIGRKVGFAEYGAQEYPISPAWLAWPHMCETTTDLPPYTIDIHNWRWAGLKE